MNLVEEVIMFKMQNNIHTAQQRGLAQRRYQASVHTFAFSLWRNWLSNKCHVHRSSADVLFFCLFWYYLLHQIRDCAHLDWNFFRRLKQTNHKGVKRKERQTNKGKTIEGENSSLVHLADDILCSPSVISFSSVKTDRIPSCVSLPLRDDCSTDVPGDTFFFSLFSLCLSRLLCGRYFLRTLWISYKPLLLLLFLPFPHLFSLFLISV